MSQPHNFEFRELAGYVGKVKRINEILIKYFLQDGISEELLQPINIINEKLDDLLKKLNSEARQEFDEETRKVIYSNRLTDWSWSLDETLVVIESIILSFFSVQDKNIEEMVKMLKELMLIKEQLIEIYGS